MKDVVIIGFEAGTQGVTLKLNKKAKLKGLNVKNDTVWVSWDKIGQALIEDYADATEVAGLDELRKEAKEGGGNG